ncbi:MAG TPA: FtsQ-type POTRA domain-containing protein [Verrucomicrobiae bacterium]|nr:FtsQ-type POTRA domain-containing protein [Verrucomicrobiae bacterium]
MIFSKHRRINAKRRFGTREFQSRVKEAQNYKRPYNPIDLNRPPRWMVIIGLKSKFYRVLWLGLIAAFAYLFMFSDLMLIDSVKVSGTNRVSQEQVLSAIDNFSGERTFFIPKNNFFLMSKARVNESLKSAIPLVKEIKSYKRTWPNRVELEVVERDPGFVLQVDDKKYLVDDEGVVIKDDAAGLDLPLVIDQVTENFDIGLPLPNTKMVAFILSMHKQWGTKINSPISIAKIPGKASNEVQIVSEEGWGVFFDTTRSVTSQLDNLSLVLSRQIPARERPNLAYIDLRLSKWAYYCFKNSPCVAGAQEDAEAVETTEEEKAEETVSPPNTKPVQ